MAIGAICMAACAAAQVKTDNSTMAGISLSSAILKESVGFAFSHAFASHWSVGGSLCIRASSSVDSRTIEEQEHYDEFKENGDTDMKQKDILTYKAFLTFWPSHGHRGSHINIGARTGHRSGTDMVTGVGYMFRIWKRMHADISVNIDMISSCRNAQITGESAEIGIYIAL